MRVRKVYVLYSVWSHLWSEKTIIFFKQTSIVSIKKRWLADSFNCKAGLPVYWLFSLTI